MACRSRPHLQAVGFEKPCRWLLPFPAFDCRQAARNLFALLPETVLATVMPVCFTLEKIFPAWPRLKAVMGIVGGSGRICGMMNHPFQIMQVLCVQYSKMSIKWQRICRHPCCGDRSRVSIGITHGREKNCFMRVVYHEAPRGQAEGADRLAWLP